LVPAPQPIVPPFPPAPQVAASLSEPPAAPPRLPRVEPNAFVSLPQAPARNPGCQQYRTAVDFYDSPAVATKNAVKEDKLVFVLHVAGNFEEPGFTWNNAEALREGALANAEVGDYLNKHFASSYQKIGTFQLVNGQKQGGNVVSYFCTTEGEILHAVPGPVDAATLLREARWVVETYKLALLEAHHDARLIKQAFRLAHADRLPAAKTKVEWKHMAFFVPTEEALSKALGRTGGAPRLNQQDQVHLLLAYYPLIQLDQAYKVIYEKVLNEKVSTRPVEEKN
jgi:hypothetical protein